MSREISVPSRNKVDKAGRILRNFNSEITDIKEAVEILSQWRSLHTYPIDAIKKIILRKLKTAYPDAIVAQRLKRFSSIVNKLDRFPNMSLARMQDIGGIRIILNSVNEIRNLHASLIQKSKSHTAELPPNDYIISPKPDGYRSLHQVFKYKSRSYPELDGMRIEVQLRTKIQHAWATAVETLGIIEKSSFKTGEGTGKFKQFFKLSSALFSHHEKVNILDEYKDFSLSDIKEMFLHVEKDLGIFSKLNGLVLSAKNIELSSKDSKGYHLMTLDLKKNRLSLIPFQDSQLEDAEFLYRKKEQETRDDPNITVVLISAGNVNEIKKAYPNYFLDTKFFIRLLNKICE